MSTKTTFKRIAFVAVAALGLGTLSSVPSQATDISLSIVDSISASVPTAPRIGTVAPITVTVVDTAAGIAAGDTVTIGAKFLVDGGKPAASTTAATVQVMGVAGTSSSTSDVDAITLTRGQDVRLSGYSATTSKYSTAALHGAVEVSADVAGTYKIQIWVNQSGGTSGYDAGEPTTTATLTTAGKPASVVLTKLSAGNPAITVGTFDSGALYSAIVKDAAGVQTRLTADEALLLSSDTSSTTTFNKPGALGTAVTSCLH